MLRGAGAEIKLRLVRRWRAGRRRRGPVRRRWHPTVRRLLRWRRRERVHLRREAALRWRGRRVLLLRRVRPVRRHGAPAARVCPNPNPSTRTSGPRPPLTSLAPPTPPPSSPPPQKLLEPRAGRPPGTHSTRSVRRRAGGAWWSAMWRLARSRMRARVEEKGR